MKEAIQLSEDFLQAGETKSSKVTAIGEIESESEGKPVEQVPEVTSVLTETLVTMKKMIELQAATLSALSQVKQPPPTEKKPLSCYQCSGPHLKRNCPQLRNTTQQSGKERGPAQSGAQLSLDQKQQ